jgi:putative membrane protein
MRNMITIINLAILFGITSIFSRHDKADKQGTSISTNELVNEGNGIGTIHSNFTVWPIQWSGDEDSKEDVETNEEANHEINRFISDMADTELLNLEHGKLATQRATTRSLKDYAASMVEVQSAMREDLKTLAEKKKVNVPKNFSEDAGRNADVFKNVHGESFDKKFISMVIKDHKRNVKKLERATRSNNAEIQVFATKYLPVVQSHLNNIRAIKKTF